MKGLIYSAVAITSLVGLAVNTVQAQIEERLRFTTSFSFMVGDTHFAPGNYLIGPADDNNDGVLRITGSRQMAFLTVIPDGLRRDDPKDNELTFEKVGGEYVLTRIYDATENSAVESARAAELLRHAEHPNKVAERVMVPFIKVS